MHISRKTHHKSHYLYSLQDTALDSVTHTKYLGVTTNDLRWNRHVANITCKANQMLGLLRRNLSASSDPAVKEAAYMSLVRPLIEYASCAWDPHTEQVIAEVEKTQRRAARFVLSDYESYEPGSMSMMLKKLGWPPLKLRRQMDRVILFNKA